MRSHWVSPVKYFPRGTRPFTRIGDKVRVKLSQPDSHRAVTPLNLDGAANGTMAGTHTSKVMICGTHRFRVQTHTHLVSEE